MKTKSVLSGADLLLGSYITSQGRKTRKKRNEGREREIEAGKKEKKEGLRQKRLANNKGTWPWLNSQGKQEGRKNKNVLIEWTLHF